MNNNISATIQSFEEKEKVLNNSIQNMKQQKAAAQALYESYSKREDEVRARITAMGLTPEVLKSKIEENVTLLADVFTNLEKLMPDANGVFPAIPTATPNGMGINNNPPLMDHSHIPDHE